MSLNRLIWRLRHIRSTVKIGRLPVELYRPIVEAIATESDDIYWLPAHIETLYTLCHVSKRFRIEAERILYRTVYLQSLRVKTHLRLFEYLSSNTNPYCPALHVRNFAIRTVPSDGRWPRHSTYWISLRDALRAMMNLKRLYLGNYYALRAHNSPPSLITRAEMTLLGSLFLGCRFRLLKFEIIRGRELAPADRGIMELQGNVEQWDF